MRTLRLKLFNQPPPKIVIVTVLKAMESVDVQICNISEKSSNFNVSQKSIVWHGGISFHLYFKCIYLRHISYTYFYSLHMIYVNVSKDILLLPCALKAIKTKGLLKSSTTQTYTTRIVRELTIVEYQHACTKTIHKNNIHVGQVLKENVYRQRRQVRKQLTRVPCNALEYNCFLIYNI